MPQNMVWPFMRRKMVDRNHGVKPRLSAAKFRESAGGVTPAGPASPRISAFAIRLLFGLAKLTQA
jgi:hypothetical protein